MSPLSPGTVSPGTWGGAALSFNSTSPSTPLYSSLRAPASPMASLGFNMTGSSGGSMTADSWSFHRNQSSILDTSFSPPSVCTVRSVYSKNEVLEFIKFICLKWCTTDVIVFVGKVCIAIILVRVINYLFQEVEFIIWYAHYWYVDIKDWKVLLIDFQTIDRHVPDQIEVSSGYRGVGRRSWELYLWVFCLIHLLQRLGIPDLKTIVIDCSWQGYSQAGFNLSQWF